MAMSHCNFSSSNLDNEMFTYEYFQQPDICRLCWTKDAAVDLFSRTTDQPSSLAEQPLVQKIQDCLGLDLRPGSDTLPSKVCATCSGYIEKMYMFKCFCHESDKTLKEIFEKHTSELSPNFSTDVKIESLTEMPEEEIFVAIQEVTASIENTIESEIENIVASENENIVEPVNGNNTASVENTIQSENTVESENENMVASENENIVASKNGNNTASLENTMESENIVESENENILEPESGNNTATLENTVESENENIVEPKNGNNTMESESENIVDLENLDSRNSFGQSPDRAKNKTSETKSKNAKPVKSKIKKQMLPTQSKNGKPIRKSSRKHGSTNMPIENKTKKQVKHKKHNKTINKDPNNTLPEFCIECKSIFKDLKQLAIHNSKVHGIEDDGMSYKCYGCKGKFSSKKNRVRHESSYCKGLKDGYKCFLCDCFLPYRKFLQRHIREHNNKDVVKAPGNIFKCKMCGKGFKTRPKLIAHKASHYPTEYVCQTCGRVFTRPDYLYLHNLIHLGLKRHQCQYCPYRATQRSSLVVHLRTHTGERPYQCDMCPQRCVSKSSLIKHLRRHVGHMQFQCKLCPKTFGCKESFTAHLNFHKCPVSYSCQYCRMSYRRKTSLNRHLRTKHHTDQRECKVKKEIASMDTEKKE